VTSKIEPANCTPLNRSRGISYQELLDTDSKPVPQVLRLESSSTLDVGHTQPEVYFSPEFHRLEMERIWLRVWQFACREEVVPEVGDTEVYSIGNYSAIIVRTASDEIKAFPNACLHRGRVLRDTGGRVTELRCPFHGFAWNLDGTLKFVPSKWDFPQLDEENFNLTELPVGRWAGFVFISFNQDVQPFEEFIGDLPEHFNQWLLEDRYTDVHVAKVLRCNWKVGQEAFMEAFHVTATHPQAVPGSGDENSQYDIFGNFSRAITPTGISSPNLRWKATENEILDILVDRGLEEDRVVEVPPGTTARELTAAATRAGLGTIIGDAPAELLSDAELVDNIYYTLFPNFHPWGSFNRIVYRFRPYGNDPEMSIFDIFLLAPFNGERPQPASVQWLGPDESMLKAPQLGVLARIFDQDTFNLPRVQQGLHNRSLDNRGVLLSSYQESKIQHFYALYQRHLEGS
jgi:phenylpropionate dioxygenase-like ring-hydroxylating dioxygenase large terminal subunit